MIGSAGNSSAGAMGGAGCLLSSAPHDGKRTGQRGHGHAGERALFDRAFKAGWKAATYTLVGRCTKPHGDKQNRTHVDLGAALHPDGRGRQTRNRLATLVEQVRSAKQLGYDTSSRSMFNTTRTLSSGRDRMNPRRSNSRLHRAPRSPIARSQTAYRVGLSTDERWAARARNVASAVQATHSAFGLPFTIRCKRMRDVRRRDARVLEDLADRADWRAARFQSEHYNLSLMTPIFAHLPAQSIRASGPESLRWQEHMLQVVGEVGDDGVLLHASALPLSPTYLRYRVSQSAQGLRQV